MKSQEILFRNHDIHLHSRDFSDGSHPVLEITRHAARWQDNPRWVGLSDHSPHENNQLQSYIQKSRIFQKELLKLDGITLLSGLELECNANGVAAMSLDLSKLDYVLAAYHGGVFSTARQVEDYFDIIIQNTYSDIVAHPDRFLGNLDTLAIGWHKIFNNFSRMSVLCEYNLTTPLHKDILDIAINQSDVNFVIGSDTHDFHNIAISRIVNAWSESLGGGFDLSREYLTNLLRIECAPKQIEIVYRLFESEQLLNRLQYRVSVNSFDPDTKKAGLLLEEEKLLDFLNSIPECELDQDFILKRLERFTSISAERITSLLPVEEFKNTIGIGRQKRKELKNSISGEK